MNSISNSEDDDNKFNLESEANFFSAPINDNYEYYPLEIPDNTNESENCSKIENVGQKNDASKTLNENPANNQVQPSPQKAVKPDNGKQLHQTGTATANQISFGGIGLRKDFEVYLQLKIKDDKNARVPKHQLIRMFKIISKMYHLPPSILNRDDKRNRDLLLAKLFTYKNIIIDSLEACPLIIAQVLYSQDT